jgi:polar amino acid transport system substrate-binding protein
MAPKAVLAAFVAGLLFAVVTPGGAPAGAQAPDPRIADLVGSGKLRVGLFLPQYVKDAATGQVRSVWIETARAFAAQIKIGLVVVEHATPPQAIACLKSGGCDLLFLPLDARAAEIGDFSNPVFQFDYTLLASAGSSVSRVADADRPGVRIAAVRNHASTNELSRQLKQAKLVYADTPDQTFDLLRNGQADVMASTRLALLDFSDRLAGSRVLEDRYGANINRMVVPKGRAGWHAYVGEFVEAAKASGLVQKAIEQGGTRGVTVAAPGNSN